MKINNAKYLIQAVNEAGWPKDEKSEFLFLGRSNVGKSSIINAITRQNKLARTSSSPGKTQTLVFFDINEGDFRIVDAPGYGYAKVPLRILKQFDAMMDEYLTKRTNLKNVLLLVDSRHEPSRDDKDMYEYLREVKIPHTIIITKCDKHSNNQMSKVKKRMFKVFEGSKVIFTSSESKLGIEEIKEMMAEKNKKINN